MKQSSIISSFPSLSREKNETITITFGDVAENHVGMQKLGSPAAAGFTVAELEEVKESFEANGYACELVNLNDALEPNDRKISTKAAILIVRNFLKDKFQPTSEPENDIASELLKEELMLNWDKKAKMYGRVVNKEVRWNLCYADEPQDPDYEIGKGRVVSWQQVPLLSHLRDLLPQYFGPKAANLVAEGNRYYDDRVPKRHKHFLKSF